MQLLPVADLKTGALEMGIELTDAQLDIMDQFARLIVQTNEKFNLTRITDPRRMVTEHFLDSLTCLDAAKIKPSAKTIDVGTGAGFPGIPIAIARPDLNVYLLDATFKKVNFLKEASKLLGLSNVECLHGRAEELGREPDFREKYDIVCARALSELRILAELCLPLVKVGGHLIAQKGPEADNELIAARSMIGTLGGGCVKMIKTPIPGSDLTRAIITIKKERSTPDRYPRHYSVITRKQQT